MSKPFFKSLRSRLHDMPKADRDQARCSVVVEFHGRPTRICSPDCRKRYLSHFTHLVLPYDRDVKDVFRPRFTPETSMEFHLCAMCGIDDKIEVTA